MITEIPVDRLLDSTSMAYQVPLDDQFGAAVASAISDNPLRGEMLAEADLEGVVLCVFGDDVYVTFSRAFG
jgi:hypothetical protein